MTILFLFPLELSLLLLFWNSTTDSVLRDNVPSQTTLLYTKRLNKTDSPIFLCVFFVSKANLLDFYFINVIKIYTTTLR